MVQLTQRAHLSNSPHSRRPQALKLQVITAAKGQCGRLASDSGPQPAKIPKFPLILDAQVRVTTEPESKRDATRAGARDCQVERGVPACPLERSNRCGSNVFLPVREDLRENVIGSWSGLVREMFFLFFFSRRVRSLVRLFG